MTEKTNRYGRTLAVCSESKEYDNSISNIKEKLQKASKHLINYINSLDKIVEKNDIELKSEVLNLYDNMDIKDKIYFEELDNFSLFNYKGMDNNIEPVVFEDRGANKKERLIKEYINLRDNFKELIRLSETSSNDEDLSDAIKKVKHDVKYFHLRYGSFAKNFKELNIDMSYPLIASCELLDKKGNITGYADILKNRVIFRKEEIKEAKNPKDALIISLHERGIVDIQYMKYLLGITEKQLLDELKGEIFIDYTNYTAINEIDTTTMLKYSYKDEYLTGNVREKKEIAEAYIKEAKRQLLDDNLPNSEIEFINYIKESLEYQVSLLQEVIPKEVEIEDIKFNLSSSFIDKEYKQDFFN